MSSTLHEALGAGPPAGVVQVTLFVPSVDRLSEPIEQAYWTDQALEVFGSLFRGATAFPPGKGVWRDDDADGALVYDETQMVISYVEEGLLLQPGVLGALRTFLRRLGREANQGEVGVVVDGTYMGITDFGQGDAA